MIEIFDDAAEECAGLIARMYVERDSGVKGLSGMHATGGAWHTDRFRIGKGWLGEAVARRLERAALPIVGSCWGNLLPIGAEYEPHAHMGSSRVAVWCLDDSGGELHVEDTVVPDRSGRLVVFAPHQKHWVPKVTRDRFTIAANLHPG